MRPARLGSGVPALPSRRVGVGTLAVLEFPLSPSLFAGSVADCVGSVAGPRADLRCPQDRALVLRHSSSWPLMSPSPRVLPYAVADDLACPTNLLVLSGPFASLQLGLGRGCGALCDSWMEAPVGVGALDQAGG